MSSPYIDHACTPRRGKRQPAVTGHPLRRCVAARLLDAGASLRDVHAVHTVHTAQTAQTAARLLDVARSARLEVALGARAEEVQLLLQQRHVVEDAHRTRERAHPTHHAPHRAAVAVGAARRRSYLGHHGVHLLPQVRVHHVRALPVRGLPLRLAKQSREPREHLAGHVERGVAKVAVVVLAEQQQRGHELLRVREEQARLETRRRVGEATVNLVVARKERHVVAEHAECAARHRVPFELLLLHLLPARSKRAPRARRGARVPP